MLSFHQIVADDFNTVNQLITEQLHSEVGLVENIGEYIFNAGGKRLRPLLVLLTAKSLCYSGNQHHSLAAVVEFIHTATLLHDDVVDVSKLRRGLPTANAQWGNAPSVLVGDFLLSRAFQMMVSMGNMGIMSILSNTMNMISEGEVQQLVNAKNPDISQENYYTVVHKKTAALFAAACETAAVLSAVPTQDCQQLKNYGYHLGMAFQLVDDMLDYSGNTEELGKNIGDDLAEGKLTLPLIYAMKNGSKKQTALIAESIREANCDHLNEIIAITQQTGALEFTYQQAKYHANTALLYLAKLADSQYRQTMTELAEFSFSRAY
jgi:octaprenyl-diphosphate synthase